MTAAASSNGIVEIAADSIYRLGGTIPRDERLSWAVAGPEYQPVNCYLLVAQAEALLIDSGVALHRSAVLSQLREVLPARCRLSVFFTRAELDCVGNIAAIADAHDLQHVYTGGVVNPFDSFDYVTAIIPEAVRFNRNAELTNLRVGEERELEVMVPRLRLLATFWAYDNATGTLFSSDAFSHVGTQGSGAPLVSDAVAVDAGDVWRHHLAKFEWLADSPGRAVVAQDIRRVFARHEVRAIAPSHGAVIVGQAAVAAHVGALLHCLDLEEGEAP